MGQAFPMQPPRWRCIVPDSWLPYVVTSAAIDQDCSSPVLNEVAAHTYSKTATRASCQTRTAAALHNCIAGLTTGQHNCQVPNHQPQPFPSHPPARTPLNTRPNHPPQPPRVTTQPNRYLRPPVSHSHHEPQSHPHLTIIADPDSVVIPQRRHLAQVIHVHEIRRADHVPAAPGGSCNRVISWLDLRHVPVGHSTDNSLAGVCVGATIQ